MNALVQLTMVEDSTRRNWVNLMTSSGESYYDTLMISFIKLQ